jgi:hypothetical protein
MALCCTTTSPELRTFLSWCMLLNRNNQRMQHIATYNMSGLGIRRFTWVERLHQLGLLPDPRASVVDR